jgi:hypothetical protein
MRRRSVCIAELAIASAAVLIMLATPRVREVKSVLSALTLDAKPVEATSTASPPPVESVSGFLVARVTLSQFFCIYRGERYVTFEVSPGNSVVAEQVRDALIADGVARRVINRTEAEKLRLESSSEPSVWFYKSGVLLNVVLAAAVLLLAGRAILELLRREV